MPTTIQDIEWLRHLQRSAVRVLMTWRDQYGRIHRYSIGLDWVDDGTWSKETKLRCFRKREKLSILRHFAKVCLAKAPSRVLTQKGIAVMASNLSGWLWCVPQFTCEVSAAFSFNAILGRQARRRRLRPWRQCTSATRDLSKSGILILATKT